MIFIVSKLQYHETYNNIVSLYWYVVYGWLS